MGQLGQKDHDALVLRFFENKNFTEVGAALGASEDAAKMRVNRALEKLRKIFTKRGVRSTTAILAGAISANSVPGRAGGPRGGHFHRGDRQRRGGGRFNPGFGERSIQTYGMDKAKMAMAVGVSVLLAAGTARRWWSNRFHHRFNCQPSQKIGGSVSRRFTNCRMESRSSISLRHSSRSGLTFITTTRVGKPRSNISRIRRPCFSSDRTGNNCVT